MGKGFGGDKRLESDLKTSNVSILYPTRAPADSVKEDLPDRTRS